MVKKKSCGISRGLGFRSYLEFLGGVTQFGGVSSGEALLCLEFPEIKVKNPKIQGGFQKSMSSTSPHLVFFFFFFGNSPLVCSPSFDFCVSGSGIPVAVQENFLGSLAYLIYHHLCYLPSLFILLPWFDASSLLGVKTPFLNDTGKD